MSSTASMIATLRGVVLEVTDGGEELIVEVSGVGYRLQSSALLLDDLDLDRSRFPDGLTRGAEVLLHVHHVVREDAQVLYGFATSDQRRVFGELLGAHGVGPALALAILSVHTPDELRSIVSSGDPGPLRGVPGVGPKTAARLLVELASRLGEPLAVPAVASGGASGDASARLVVRDALVGLGYQQDEIRGVLADLPDDGDTSELLRTALQRLAVA